MAYDVTTGSADVSLAVHAVDNRTGQPLTGLLAANVTAYYYRQGAAGVEISLSDLSAVDDAHTDGGWIALDATNAPGWYRLDVPDAAVAGGADWVTFGLTTSNGLLAVMSDGVVAIVDEVSIANTVVLGAIQTTAHGGNRTSSPIALEQFMRETKTYSLTVLDADGDPVDLSALTLRFVVIDGQTPPVAQFEVEGGDIVISGDDNEIALVTVAAAKVPAVQNGWHWALWSISATPYVLLHGGFTIKPAQDDYS